MHKDSQTQEVGFAEHVDRILGSLHRGPPAPGFPMCLQKLSMRPFTRSPASWVSGQPGAKKH